MEPRKQVFDPLRQVFVRAVEELAPDVEVLQPWRRTEDVSVFRGIFEAAGIADVVITTDDGLADADYGAIIPFIRDR